MIAERETMKQRTIRGAKRGKKPMVRQSKRFDPVPRHWRAGKMPNGRKLNDPRDLEDERAWLDW